MRPNFPQCYKIDSKPSKFCPGCSQTLILKNLGFVIDELKIASKVVYGCDIGCMLLSWDFFDLNTVQTHHGRTGPTMVGLKYAAPERIVIAYMGDGGAYAIGAQHLVASSMRNDPITMIICNNTVYAMTGGQEAPTTLCNEITTSTIRGRVCNGSRPLLGPELVRSLNKKAYVARGTTLNISQMKNFIKRAILHQKKGNFSFLEILSGCPINWKTDARETREFLKEIEKTFPTGEIP